MTRTTSLTSIITGDIIGSRTTTSSKWLSPLKKALSFHGNSPYAWDIFRGDSFQVEIKHPTDALFAALHIKATLKTTKAVDVRMAIGIGSIISRARKITESEGEAFLFSGEKYETLKKDKVTLAIRTPWPTFDHEMNICLRLVALLVDGWSPGSAELFKLLLEEPTLNQEKIARKLNVTQPSVSERHQRAHYDEIMAFEALFREKVQQYIANA